ncbi:MAG: hypothetical protein AB7I50_05985 [Vicinamibacterales bacterium]
MSVRLQILVSEAMEKRVRKAAQRRQLSTSAWVRQAVERALADDRPSGDPLEQLAQLGAPTADIDQMLAEIDAGRG